MKMTDFELAKLVCDHRAYGKAYQNAINHPQTCKEIKPLLMELGAAEFCFADAYSRQLRANAVRLEMFT